MNPFPTDTFPEEHPSEPRAYPSAPSDAPGSSRGPGTDTMNILYIGAEAAGTTSLHRADALRRLGHEVTIVDPIKILPTNRILRQINFRTGYRLFTRDVFRLIQQRVGDRHFDVAWVNGGYAVPPACVRWLKGHARFVLTYANDDPTGPRDPSKWATFCRAIPAYDLCVVVRDFNRQEYLDLGAKEVLRVMMGYDEVAHARLPFSAEDEKEWGSEVVFVGTWMPERGPFIAELIRHGVPLAIYGDRWDKAGEWPLIKPHWRSAYASGPNYVKAIQYAKISIGMLSKGNRDMHTQRSSEIPFIGSVFCAERTPEHAQMFQEGEEAIFWRDAAECAAACRRLLADDAKRLRMVEAARAKLQSLALGNEAVCARILQAVAR